MRIIPLMSEELCQSTPDEDLASNVIPSCSEVCLPAFYFAQILKHFSVPLTTRVMPHISEISSIIHLYAAKRTSYIHTEHTGCWAFQGPSGRNHLVNCRMYQVPPGRKAIGAHNSYTLAAVLNISDRSGWSTPTLLLDLPGTASLPLMSIKW